MVGPDIQIGTAILAQDRLDDQILAVLGKAKADIPPLPFRGPHFAGRQPANDLSAQTHKVLSYKRNDLQFYRSIFYPEDMTTDICLLTTAGFYPLVSASDRGSVTNNSPAPPDPDGQAFRWDPGRPRHYCRCRSFPTVFL